MGYGPSDMISEWISSSDWFSYEVGAEDPWNPYDEDDKRTPAKAIADEYDECDFDPEKIGKEIDAYFKRWEAAAKELGKVEHTRPDGTTYTTRALHAWPYFDVAPDGFWHHDTAQIYAYFENDPYLTPDEWLDRKIAAAKDNT